MKKSMGLFFGIFAGLCAFLCIASSLYADGIYEPAVVVVWNGSHAQSMQPGTGIPVPAGSKVDVTSWNGHTVISITTPGDAAPGGGGGGGGAVPGLDQNNPRIQSHNGTTYEIPNPDDVDKVEQQGDTVKVTYKDGSTAEVPGTYLPPGTPNPSTPNENEAELEFPDPELDMDPDFYDDLLGEDWFDDIFGGDLEIDDFNDPLNPQDPPDLYIIKPGPTIDSFFDVFFELDFPSVQGTDVLRLSSIPEPTTLILLAIGLAGGLLRKRMR